MSSAQNLSFVWGLLISWPSVFVWGPEACLSAVFRRKARPLQRNTVFAVARIVYVLPGDFSNVRASVHNVVKKVTWNFSHHWHCIISKKVSSTDGCRLTVVHRDYLNICSFKISFIQSCEFWSFPGWSQDIMSWAVYLSRESMYWH